MRSEFRPRRLKIVSDAICFSAISFGRTFPDLCVAIPLCDRTRNMERWATVTSQPTLSRWENSPAPRDLLRLQDALLDWFVKICGKQVRKRGEILLDVDSTDDPTHGQQQLSFFNGGYGQPMNHPLLIFERHRGCLLGARLRPGSVVSLARIIPLLLRIVPRLRREFPKVRIKLRADAGFATPL